MNKFSFRTWCRFFGTTRSLLKGGPPTPDTCCPTKLEYGPPNVHRAVFLNGMKVAAGKPLGGDIAACTVLYQAGSAYEFDDALGATHFLRAASSTTGMTHTAFMRSRYLQQAGGYITCTSDRQTISYTLRCPSSIFPDLRSFLADSAAKCYYPDHELEEIRKLVREDLDRRPPEQHVLDLVQKACFSGPYNNSVYCEEGRLDTIDSQVLNEYVERFFKTSACTIGSTNLCYNETMKVAAQIDCNRSEKPNTSYFLPLSCPRGGYEFYDTGPGVTYMAFAVPGAATCDFRNVLKHAILAATCGLGNVHQGSDEMDRTPHQPLGMLSEQENDPQTDFKAFNISYLCDGCFGILVKTYSEMAKCSGFKAAQFLGNLCQLTPKDIEVGKKRLKLGLMFNDESSVRVSESLAFLGAANQTFDNALELCQMIDKISPEEVLGVASCISQKRCAGQMAVAVVGDVEAAPHDAELRCCF